MALLTVLAIKGGFLCDFTKILKGRHFMGHSGTGLKFSITIDLKYSKLTSYSFFKKYVKNTYFGPK